MASVCSKPHFLSYVPLSTMQAQMVFENNFELYYKDIKNFEWIEVDSVDDLLKARLIQQTSIISV